MADVSVRDPGKTHKRQKLLLLGGGGALFLLVFLLIAASEDGGNTNAPPPVEVNRTDIKAAGSDLTDSEIWVANSEATLKELRESMKDLQGQMQRMERDNERLREDLAEARDRIAEGDAIKGDPLAAEDSPFAAPPPPPTMADITGGSSSSSAASGSSSSGPVMPPPPGGGSKTAEADKPEEAKPVRGIARVSLSGGSSKPSKSKSEGGSGEGAGKDGGAEGEGESSGKNVGTYIPSGSFVQADIIGGLDAPTGGQAQSDPHPILMRLIDHSILPNRYRGRVKDCHMVGAGYGDISSERAYIRVESLSCVLPGGDVIDQPVEAYVVGEDGKTGVRGRLVSKQGQLIARSLLAGIVGGIGEGFSQASSSINTTTAGATTQTIETGKVAQYGVSKGVGSAMERLADYYIEAAERTYPIIEVPAGRTVSVVFVKGATLDGDINGGGERGTQPIVTDEDKALATTGTRNRVKIH